MGLLLHLLQTGLATMLDVGPIVAVLAVFQAAVLRRRPPHLRRVAVGAVYVLIGLTLFLVGLEEALFPIGRIMARQLTDPAFLGIAAGNADWLEFVWVYAFAAAVGFSAAIAEPSLLAIAIKANRISGGALGTLRIVTGMPLVWYMIAGYAVLIVQTWRTVRVAADIVPLAYDSGGVTTSTVTVPLVAALGLGLAASIPGRSPALDGFGLIASTALFPMVSVMGYAQLAAWRARRLNARRGNARDAGAAEDERSTT